MTKLEWLCCCWCFFSPARKLYFKLFWHSGCAIHEYQSHQLSYVITLHLFWPIGLEKNSWNECRSVHFEYFFLSVLYSIKSLAFLLRVTKNRFLPFHSHVKKASVTGKIKVPIHKIKRYGWKYGNQHITRKK